jgi:SRSO17 transposase
MKQDQHTTFTASRTTSADLCRWAQALFGLHSRLAPRFARPEPRRRALAYLQGILSATWRKNGWQLAEHAGEARPDGMQRLLSQAVWDTDGVRDDLRSYALEQLGQQSAMLVIDETSFPKRGTKSAGVGWQYGGTTGQVQNCQVGVFLSSVTAKGHTLIDRELSLPMEWCEDRQRCREASIPESVPFRTKPELALPMLERLFQAQLPFAWVVADTVYGGNLDLRGFLEAHQSPCSSVAALPTRTRKPTTSSSLPQAPRCQRWYGPREPDGISRKILKTAKTWAWTTTRCAATWAGIATSPWECWLMPSWQPSVLPPITPRRLLLASRPLARPSR